MKAANDNDLSPQNLPMGEAQRRTREEWPHERDDYCKGAPDVTEGVRRWQVFNEKCMKDLHFWQETLRNPSKPIPDEAKTRIHRLIRNAREQIRYNDERINWLLYGSWREERARHRERITREVAQLMRLAPFPALDIF